ncbi:MAG: pyridoxal-phosphate dependent enzyme, partial [Actinobacteria bacterium]|nr:pyridoxal-phosphate dependent enzyme [Actinomycetota bacterium]
MSFVTHLESSIDGTHLSHLGLQTLHEDRPLWVRYDLDAVAGAMKKEDLIDREPTMWRYRELLPVADDTKISSLGEGMTPLLKCERLGAALGLTDLWVKDESQLPTGSFKSRGLAMAVSRANELGVTSLAIPTAGNAGGAMAAYAARVGIDAYVFMPADTPIVNQHEAAYYGAHTFLVNGLITDCGAIVREGTPHM